MYRDAMQLTPAVQPPREAGALFRAMLDGELIARLVQREATRRWRRRGLRASLGKVERAHLVGSVRRRLLGEPFDELDVRSIPKSDGSERQLLVASFVDTVLERVMLEVLRPHLRRVGVYPRGVHQQLRNLAVRMRGAEFVARCDVEAAFPSVLHATVVATFAALVGQAADVARLLARLLARMPGGVGLPTGTPLSPWLLEVALAELDVRCSRRWRTFTRYADDVAVPLDSSRAAEAVDLLQRSFARDGLALNRRKTAVVAVEDGVEFVGHLLRQERGVVRVHASPRSIRTFLAREAERRALAFGSNPHTNNQEEEYAAEHQRRLVGLRSFYRDADPLSLELMLNGSGKPVAHV